jgi:peptide deformylase
MKLFTILKDDHPTLKKAAEPVAVFDQKLKDTAARMIATMIKAGGIGLAAPQVGILKRIIVMAVPSPTGIKGFPKVLVNPKIIGKSEKTITGPEGCLSYPGKTYSVERNESLIVKYQDVHGNFKQEMFEGLSSVCVQHELDHLNGITFNTKGK